jgi:endoglucanase
MIPGLFVRPFLLGLALLVASGFSLTARADDTASLIKNPGMETDSNQDGWPDNWPHLKSGGSWETEGGNHFIRLSAPEPGKLTSLYLEVPVPAGVQALEVSWRWRLTNVKPGEKPWFDARFMMEFMDGSRAKLNPSPSPAYGKGSTKGWIDKKISFLVPEGAKFLKFMPSLFNVASGTMDIDDIVIRPTDPAGPLAAAKEREEVQKAKFVPPETANKSKWPAELHVQGNRLANPEGKEVWLQGLNAGGLETLPQDTQPIKSTLVGIDEWKANAVRLPVNETNWFGRNPLQKDGGQSYRDYVDQCVMIAANRGAYLILDLHRFRAPKAEHVEFWKDAAARYKNHPAVLFDLFNEPHGISWQVWRDGGFVGEKKGADESAFLSEDEKKKNQGFDSVGMQALVDAVRSTGAKNIVIAGGLGWAGDLSGVDEGYELKDTDGNGVMYSWHQYNWHKGWAKTVLPVAAKHPVLVGEVGADIKKMDFIPQSAQEDPYTWVPDMLGFIQKYRLNWTGWCFHPRATPVMISDWKYTPTPFWGVFAKDALAGKQFEMKRMR